MTDKRCLYCYQKLNEHSNGVQSDFHSGCSRKFFGNSTPPQLPYSDEDIGELAKIVVKSHIAIPGVQPKLSLGLQKQPDKAIPHKLTIVGLWGGFILKPQSKVFNNLPELEDLTMHLARIARINTVEHSLIRLQSGELAYITKRIDRKKEEKFHMEDMCQLTERLTEHKYKGSYEQIGRAIEKFSANPGLDIINFFEQVIFSFLTGNNDMHLKNFSLLKNKILGYNLCPAYDMIASELVVEGDDEELALTLNGKKRKLGRSDFEAVMTSFKIDGKARNKVFSRLEKAIPEWKNMIDISFIPGEMKKRYQDLIEKKAKQLEIGT